MEVFLCPKCKERPLFYKGCKNCGSGGIGTSRLVHHFACAHVDSLDNFEYKGSIRCPKCLTTNLIAGTDFEYIDGPYTCQECNWLDSNFEITGLCEKCQVRFPILFRSGNE